MALVDLAAAKAHCHVTDARQDADVQRFVDQATAIVLDYVQDHPDAKTWTEATVPAPVQLGILLTTAYYYRKNRGDLPPTGDDQGLWAELRPLLGRFRTPAFA
jgi:hypothetical protein